jgi:hypothetical protein
LVFFLISFDTTVISTGRAESAISSSASSLDVLLPQMMPFLDLDAKVLDSPNYLHVIQKTAVMHLLNKEEQIKRKINHTRRKQQSGKTLYHR